MTLTRNQSLIIISIICFTLISGSLYYYFDNRYYFGKYGGSYYEGFEMYLSESNAYISYDALNLTNSSINHITNDTFSLVIEIDTPEGNQSAIYPFVKYPPVYTPLGVELNYSSRFNGIFYDTYKTNESYNFTIRWIINSTDPELLNLSLLGNDNRITGSFFVEPNFNTNASVDHKFLDVCTVINDRGRSKIIMPFEMEIIIRPLIICVD